MEVLICAGRFLWIQELNIILDELEKVGEKIKSLVADVGSMNEKVARGVQYAEDMWSWKHWAVEFVEAAKEC